MIDPEYWARLGKLLHIPKHKMRKVQEQYGTLDALMDIPACPYLTERELQRLQEFVVLSRLSLRLPNVPLASYYIDLLQEVIGGGPGEKLWIIPRTGQVTYPPRLMAVGEGGHVHVPHGAILGYLLRMGADSFVMAHSHGVGSSRPSKEDLQMTDHMAFWAHLFGITLQDHLILTPYTLYSIAASGKLKCLSIPEGWEQGCMLVMEGAPPEALGSEEEEVELEHSLWDAVEVVEEESGEDEGVPD